MTDTTSMTQSGFKPIKTDVLGRARFSKEDREKILNAFEESHLSGVAFAQHCGVNYQTFATWIQKRRRQRGEYPAVKGQRSIATDATNKSGNGFIELELNTSAGQPAVEHDTQGVALQLRGGACIKLTSSSDLKLVAELLTELERSRSC